MDSSSAVLIIKALDCLSTRAVATAENIANAGSPGYRPLRTNFEDALKAAASVGDDAVRNVSANVQRAISGTPEGQMRLDLEMSTASATAGRYDALLELLNRQLQLQTLAITGT